ncbi:TMA17 (YDL110C) [Zygosaccharomyces parabailii]|nr:TMA17 (YDL110C) [Zygosaccharomyces parabailii]CDH08801.1 uncharacterized protein ZBAI_00584 [Zygosaccharomyces bailii ISA1307]
MSAGGIRRPVQIEEFKTAIGNMPSDELARIRHEIENSVKHLNRSNSRLMKYVAKIEGRVRDSPDLESSDDLESFEEGDLQLYQDSLRENEVVLKNYQERIEALDQENMYRSNNGGKSSSSQKAKDAPVKGESNAAGNSIYL